jgi:dTMP kinase
MQMPGKLISIEGPDGSGKTSLAGLLAEDLAARYPMTRVREPGGTVISEQIRKIILDPAHQEISWRTEALLYVAARAQVVDEVIRPALSRGEIVICDRFIDSTIAYQGYGRLLPVRDLELLNQVATGGIQPDLTILLDLDVEIALRRCARSGKLDRLEKEDLVFHRRVREGFLAQARKTPERIRVVAADQPIARVFAETRAIVTTFLEKTMADRENGSRSGLTAET